MMAAVSAKSLTSGIGSASARSEDRICRDGGPACRLTNATPGTSNSGANVANPALRRRSSVPNPGKDGLACPAHTNPTRKPPLGSRLAQCRTSAASGSQNRSGRNGVDRRAEDPWQAEHRANKIVRRQAMRVGHHLGHAGHHPHHPLQCRRHACHHLRASFGQQRQVAQELQSIAEPVLMQRQDGQTRQPVGGTQGWHKPIVIDRGRAGQEQPRFVILPRRRPSPHFQQGHRPIDTKPVIGWVQCHRPVMRCDGFVEPPLDLQHHAKVRPACRGVRVQGHGTLEAVDGGREMAKLRLTRPIRWWPATDVWPVREDRFCLRRLAGVEQERGEIQPQPVVGLGSARHARNCRATSARGSGGFSRASSRHGWSGVRPHSRGMHQDRGRTVSLPHRGDGQPQQQRGMWVVRIVGYGCACGGFRLLPRAGRQWPQRGRQEFR